MLTYPVVNDHADLTKVVDLILAEAGLDPIRHTHIKVGAMSATCLAANAIATAIVWRTRTGEGQDVHVDLRKSYVAQSPWQANLVRYTTVNGETQMMGGNIG